MPDKKRTATDDGREQLSNRSVALSTPLAATSGLVMWSIDDIQVDPLSFDFEDWAKTG